MISTCQNCERETESPLPLKDVLQRVAPGELMPSGECPDCGAVCHGPRAAFSVSRGSLARFEDIEPESLFIQGDTLLVKCDQYTARNPSTDCFHSLFSHYEVNHAQVIDNR